MNEAKPDAVAMHYAIASALSFSALAAPFVPEAVLAYAGYRYLRHFTYSWRRWRVPARVPLHLGRRGYRDETTRTRGDAGWPVGLAATGQVWLRREDLVQGLALESDDPAWQAEAIGTLVFGACLNRMGAIVVQGAADPPLTDRLAWIAAPFGRDGELLTFDLDAAPQPPLRIATSTLAAALADIGVGPEAAALNQSLLPILEMLAVRYKKNPLALYSAFVDEAALDRLVEGQYEIDGMTVRAETSTSSDGVALGRVLESLRKIPPEKREIGRQALVVHAQELAGLRGFSLTEGVDLSTAISASGLVCIRPSSALTTALVVARLIEALSAGEAGHARNALVHVAYPDLLSGAGAKRFRTVAQQAEAIGTLSLPEQPANHIHKATKKTCAVRLTSRVIGGDAPNRAGKIVSAVKGCSFALDVRLPETRESPPRLIQVITDRSRNNA